MRIRITTLRLVLVSITLILLTVTAIWFYEGAKFPQLRSTVKDTSWQLTLIKKYELCGHTEISQSIYQSESELQKIIQQYPGAEVKRELNRYEVTIRIADWCESCRRHRFLGVDDKEVVVKRGVPGQPGPVLELTGLLIQMLPVTEISDLRKGIPFVNEEEKLELLEGINSLIVD